MVVVADLVARVRQEGLAETTSALAATGQQARATGDQLDQLARKFAATQGGTASGWRDILSKQALDAKEVADQLGAAVNNATRLASAAQQTSRAGAGLNVSQAFATLENSRATEQEGRLNAARRDQQRLFDQLTAGRNAALAAAEGNAARLAEQSNRIVAPTQAAAKAATDLHEGFRLSESSALRFGLGVVGIGAGLSLVTKVAEVVHGAIVGTVNAQTDWERGLVRARVLYGDIGRQVVEISKAQAAAPGELGNQGVRLDANLNAAYLTTRYGLSPLLRNRLTSASAAVSYAFAEDEQGQRDRQARMLAFAEGGGDMLRDIGVEGRPIDFARRLGGVNPEQLQAFTAPQLVRIQALRGIEGAESAALEGERDRPGLLAARAGYEKALGDAQSRLQNYLEGSTGDDAKLRANILSQAPRNAIEAQQQQEQLAAIEARAPTQQVEDARRALEANIKAITDHTKALEDARRDLNSMGIEVGGAVWRILGFSGDPEDPLSIARADVGAQVQAGLSARRRSAIPGIGTPDREIAGVASDNAYAMAYQNYTARRAQQQNIDANREFLERRAVAEAGNRERSESLQRAAESNTPAGRALAEAERTRPVLQHMDEIRRAGLQTDMQAAQQQANLEQITLRQRERGLQLMRETVDLRRLDNQQQQAGIRAGIGVTRAQQAGLPAQYALEDAQFQSTQAEVLVRARMARQLQGKDVSDLPSYTDLIQMNIEGQFAAAEAGPGALAGARGVQLAQRPATAAALGQQLTAGQIQLGQLGVDLANLGDLPEQTALELELVQTSRDQLAVQKDLRDATRELVRIMGGQPVPGAGGPGGFVADAAAPPASSQLAGARR